MFELIESGLLEPGPEKRREEEVRGAPGEGREERFGVTTVEAMPSEERRPSGDASGREEVAVGSEELEAEMEDEEVEFELEKRSVLSSVASDANCILCRTWKNGLSG